MRRTVVASWALTVGAALILVGVALLVLKAHRPPRGAGNVASSNAPGQNGASIGARAEEERRSGDGGVVAKPEAPVTNETDAPTLEAAIGRLGCLKPGPQTDEAVAGLARHGNAAVAEIGRQLAEQ